jgi:hypothetical protein
MSIVAENRTLTDGDVRAIVSGIKEEIAKDLKLEVGGALLRWLKAAFFGLIIAGAVWGFAHANGYSVHGPSAAQP